MDKKDEGLKTYHNGHEVFNENQESFLFKKVIPNHERIEEGVADGRPFITSVFCENLGSATNYIVRETPVLISNISKSILKKTPIGKIGDGEVVDFIMNPVSSYLKETGEYAAPFADRAVTNHCYDALWYDPKIIPPFPFNQGDNKPIRLSKYAEEYAEKSKATFDPYEKIIINTDYFDQNKNKTNIKPISESDSLKNQRKTLKQNLNNYGIKVNDSRIENINVIEINDKLTQITTQLNDISNIQKEQLENLNEQERQNNLLTLSAEMSNLGRLLDCKPLEVVGKVLELGLTIEKFTVSINSLSKKVSEVGISAYAGPIGIGLAAINIILSLALTNEPSAELQYLQHITKQIDQLAQQMTEMRQEIHEGFLGLSKLQIKTFEILKSCLTHLHHDLNGIILGQFQVLKYDFNNIQSSLDYLARLQHIAFDNQFIQPLNHLCTETQSIQLNQTNKAKLLSDGLKIWIKGEIKNKLLNGSIIIEAESTIERKIELLSKCLSDDDNSNKQICSLLGYLLKRQDVYNPFILNYATSHYIQHSKRFYFLQTGENEQFIDEMISEVKNQKQIISDASNEETSQQYIEAYYQALMEVKNAQDACVDAFNQNRFEFYNRSYIEQVFYKGSEDNPPLEPNIFNLKKPIEDLIAQFLNHSIQHPQTEYRFNLADLNQQTAYSNQTIVLHRLFFELKNSNENLRTNLSKLWCLDFFNKANFEITIPHPIIESNQISNSSNGKVFKEVRLEDNGIGLEPLDIKYQISIDENHFLKFTKEPNQYKNRYNEYHLFKANEGRRQEKLEDRTLNTPIVLEFKLKNKHREFITFKYQTYGEGLVVKNAHDKSNIIRELPQHIATRFSDLTANFRCTEITTANLDDIQETLNQVWQAERSTLLNKFNELTFIVSDKNETNCFINYKKALKKLDYAAYNLKMHAYLHGFKFPENVQIVTSEIIKRETLDSNNIPANQALCLSPSLEQALDEWTPRISRSDFLVINNLPPSHPVSLLNQTQQSLIIFKSWLQYIQLTQKDLFNPFIHQKVLNVFLNTMADFRDENYQQNFDILTDSLREVILKLDHPQALGIRSAEEYKHCYDKIGCWLLKDAKNSQLLNGLVTNHNRPLDITKLERGWEVNLAYLTEKAVAILQKNKIPSLLTSNDVNFTNYNIFYVACIYLLKLTHLQSASEYAKSGNLIEKQPYLFNDALKIAKGLESTIEKIALSEGLFEYLFDEYINTLKSLVSPEIVDSDVAIFTTWTNTNENDISPIQHLFNDHKRILLETFLLIKNFSEMAFDNRLSSLLTTFKSISLTRNDEFNDYLNPNSKANSLKERINQYINEITEVKEATISHIIYNKNLKQFARFLKQNQNATDLVIEPSVLGHQSISFSEDHIELLNQYLEYNKNVNTLVFHSFELTEELVHLLVICIRQHFHIKHIEFVQTNFQATYFDYLVELLPQLISLNLEHNRLGAQGNDALQKLMNFSKQAFIYPQFEKLGLDANEFDDRARAVLHVVMDEIIELHAIDNHHEVVQLNNKEKLKTFKLNIPITYGHLSLRLLINSLEQGQQHSQKQVEDLNRSLMGHVLNQIGFYKNSNSQNQDSETTNTCTVS